MSVTRPIRRLRSLIDRAFDRRHGTETSRVVALPALDIPSLNAGRGMFYEPIPPRVFRRAMRHLPIAHDQFTFIDFGSGKGRAVLLAQEFPFAEVIGVEFSPELHRIARHNLAVCRRLHRRCAKVTLICADVVDYRVPRANLVLFFFDPFDEIVLSRVLDNVAVAIKGTTHRVHIVYCHGRPGLTLGTSALVRSERHVPAPWLPSRPRRWISHVSLYSNRPD
jgi:SAM-dependent methyltransferase